MTNSMKHSLKINFVFLSSVGKSFEMLNHGDKMPCELSHGLQLIHQVNILLNIYISSPTPNY